MTYATCLETEQPEGRRSHAWQATGLDTRDGVLVNTRHCVWCQLHQVKAYGKKGAWRDVR